MVWVTVSFRHKKKWDIFFPFKVEYLTGFIVSPPCSSMNLSGLWCGGHVQQRRRGMFILQEPEDQTDPMGQFPHSHGQPSGHWQSSTSEDSASCKGQRWPYQSKSPGYPHPSAHTATHRPGAKLKHWTSGEVWDWTTLTLVCRWKRGPSRRGLVIGWAVRPLKSWVTGGLDEVKASQSYA